MRKGCLVQCCCHSFCLWACFHLLGAFFHKLFRRFLDSRSVVQQQRNVHTYTALYCPPETFSICRDSRGWNFPLKLDDTRMCAYLSQITFAAVGLVFTRCPRRAPSQVSSWCPLCQCPRRSPSYTRRETLYRHVWIMLRRVIDWSIYSGAGRAPMVTQPAMYRQSKKG